MAQSVKCLPDKYKELSSDSQNPYKIVTKSSTFLRPQPWIRAETGGSLKFAELINKVHVQRPSSQNIKVERDKDAQYEPACTQHHKHTTKYTHTCTHIHERGRDFFDSSHNRIQVKTTEI